MSGIGQVCMTYCKLVHGDHIEYGQVPTKNYEVGFCFIIPVPQLIDVMKEYSKYCKKMVYMTVCETETVHPLYERLFELSDTFYTPSEFSSSRLKRQFPQGNFPILRHYAHPCITNVSPIPEISELENKFVFYHIGNVIDPRKNIKPIIETFLRLQLPNSVLLLKATCNQPVHWKIPGVVVLEGLMTKEHLEYIHKVGDCYVSFSHSEGAGMGAIEACMRNKMVILPEYGAGTEYIDTPYIIPCGTKKVGKDDFLFTKDMVWGDPDRNFLLKYMKDAYDKGKGALVVSQKTHEIMGSVPPSFAKILFSNEQ